MATAVGAFRARKGNEATQQHEQTTGPPAANVSGGNDGAWRRVVLVDGEVAVVVILDVEGSINAQTRQIPTGGTSL